jgi:hypothetical protein
VVGVEEVILTVLQTVEEVVPVPPPEVGVVSVPPAIQAAGGSNDDDDNDNDDEGALRISFMETLSGKHWYKCPICLGEEYEFTSKVLLHIFDFIANNARAPNVIKQHH